MKKFGFTIIELIIYIGLTAIILVVSLNIAWQVVNNQTKQSALSEVQYVGTFALNTIAYQGSRASSLGGSVYLNNPGKIVLTYPSNPQVTIDTYDKQITVNATNITIKKLRIQIGVNPAVDLTSDRVHVTNFVITSRSSPASAAAQIDLTLETANTGNNRTFFVTNSWRTTFTCQKPL